MTRFPELKEVLDKYLKELQKEKEQLKLVDKIPFKHVSKW